MTSTNLKTQIETLFNDNESGDITALDLRTISEYLLKKAGGMAFYDNSIVTPQSVVADVWDIVAIDGLGVNTYESSLPYYITTPMVSSNKMSFADVELFQTVHSRMALNVVTSSPNQVIHLKGVGRTPDSTEVVSLSMGDHFFKNAGAYELTPHFMTFNTPILNGGTLEVQIKSDADFTVLAESVLIRIAG